MKMETDRWEHMQGLVNIIPAADLLDYPRPQPLIEGFIQEQEAVCVYGEPNGGKSFLALDWALCIATGKPWLDTYPVKAGPVVYMAGEGAASLQDRVQAWLRFHQIRQIPGMFFQLRPLPLRDEETIVEIQAVLETYALEERGEGEPNMQPRLIVVDTLSQFMMGGDEVGPDMALFVSNVRRLSQDNNTAVLIVHHTNASGDRERGHTSLRGNVDVMFKCSPTYQNNVLVGLDLANDKQRDKSRAEKLPLRLRKVKLSKDRDSLVVVPTIAPPSTLPSVKDALLRVLEAMLQKEDLNSERCLNTDLCNYTGILRGTMHKHLDRLEYLKCVKRGTGKSYLTPLGRAVLDAEGIKREDPEEVK